MRPSDDDARQANPYNDDRTGGTMADRNTWLKGDERGAADRGAGPSHSAGGLFEIHIEGQLDSRWSEWLEGLEMEPLENGEMILFGPIVDQAALMGVLNKLSYLNLTLLSVSKVRELTEDKDQHEEE
jgi:hypothetical protein